MEFQKIESSPAKGLELFVSVESNGLLFSLAGDSDLGERSIRRPKLRVDSGLTFIPNATIPTEWDWETIEHPHKRVTVYSQQLTSGRLLIQVGKGDIVMRGWIARDLYTDVSMCYIPN